METINAAIKEMMEGVSRDEWKTVAVAVAPSTVSVTFMDGQDPIECRVRFLSFLGIGQNVQQAAFIMHTAQVISSRNPSLLSIGYWVTMECSYWSAEDTYCSRSTCPDFKLFLNAQTDKIVSILLKSLLDLA